MAQEPPCMDQQICYKCGQLKPLADFYHDPKSGRPWSQCRPCRNAQLRENYRHRGAEETKYRRDRYRNISPEALEQKRKRELLRLQKEEIKKKKAEYDREYHRRPEVRARDRARVTSENGRKRRRVIRHNRNAMEGRFTQDDIERIAKMQMGRCAICRKKIGKDQHIDHIIPIKRGGTNWPRNLQLLCPPCNIKKSARDPLDHMRALGRLL